MRLSAFISQVCKENLRIPIDVRIGVTGHRKIKDDQLILDSIKKILYLLDDILSNTPHTFIIISSLSEGADRLAAEQVLIWPATEKNYEPFLEAILPLSEDEYIHDFRTEKSKKDFKAFLKRARTVTTIPKMETRELAYECAGHSLVDGSDIIIAIWDGQPARGRGGTADILRYANRNYKYIFWISSDTGNIIENPNIVDLEYKFGNQLLNCFKLLNAYNKEHLDDMKLKDKIQSYFRVIEARAQDAGLRGTALESLNEILLMHFVKADLLALRYQRHHILTGLITYSLAVTAVGTVTMQTLFYPQYPGLLWFEFIQISVIISIVLYSRIREWHRRWIDYRFIAEYLRAAIFLSFAQMECELPRNQPYFYKSQLFEDWKERAFMWFCRSRPQVKIDSKTDFYAIKNFLLNEWIDDQERYYIITSDKYKKRYEKLDKIGLFVFIITLIAAALHAVGIGHNWLHEFESLPNILTLIAIVLPAAGSSLAGIRAYRGYQLNSERYEHMAKHLNEIRREISKTNDNEIFIQLLESAKDIMLSEHQDWCIITGVSKPEI